MIKNIESPCAEIDEFPSSSKAVEVSQTTVTFSNGMELVLNNDNSKLDGDTMVVYLSRKEIKDLGLDKYIKR